MTWQKMWASAETGWIIVEGIHCFFLFDDEGHSIDDVATLEEAMALAENLDELKEERRIAAARLAASDQLVQAIKDSLESPGDTE